MYNKRSVNIVVIFLVFTFFIVFQSFNVIRQNAKNKKQVVVEKDSETKFQVLNYYSVSGAKPNLNINASVLTIVNNTDLFFDEPEGFFLNDKEQKVTYTASSGSYKGETKELDLKGDVKLKTATGDHESSKIYYNGNQRFISATGEVKSTLLDTKTSDSIHIQSDYMNSWIDEGRSLFLGKVSGKVSRKRVYEESFDFKSEKLQVNQLKSLISLSNQVELDRNNYHLEAGKAEIFLENFNKKLKYYVLYDDIKLVEKLDLKEGKKQLRRAYSEKLEGYMSEGKIVLSGAPRVESGSDLIKGYQITLRENVELVEVDDSQSSFELNKKTN